jgi:DNA-binding NtrC family response regulator
MKILIVDDEQLVRWFLERALGKKGHEVILVSNISDAEELLKKEKFDILFTDLKMPEGNGALLIQKVNEMSHIPKIVVCSAYITPEMERDFKDKGILTLKKPFKLAELEETLKKLTPFN